MYEPYSEERIVETQRFWSEYSGQEVTRDDAIEIIRNLTAYFELLMEWDAEKRNSTGEVTLNEG